MKKKKKEKKKSDSGCVSVVLEDTRHVSRAIWRSDMNIVVPVIQATIA